MLSALVRGALIALGLLVMLAGIAVITTLPGGDPISGLQLVAFGAVIVVASVIERQRYRSSAAERSGAPTGPGGGEPAGALEARFRPTTELFIDPTTGRRMRVVVDPASGERRYVAEG
ncbi:MAG: hypothetical protein ABI620_01915 [Chloroflexota bacterium]